MISLIYIFSYFFSIKKQNIIFKFFIINFLRKLFIPDLIKKEIIVNPKKWNNSLKADNNAVSIRVLLDNHLCWTISPPRLRCAASNDQILLN